ncbi:MAG: alpha/beta fold hydrolase [Proteobacteria bacterium]|nr:alpha/beta fold hydrolase [Pseudomonadota bacterium]
MKEKPFLFGDHKSLFGIVTEPRGGLDVSQPGIIILNAGIVHRIGPHRKSVKIARRLADQGFLVMRFDQSGIGDSEPRRDALSFDDGALDDIRQAVEHLQDTRKIDRFILMGLCSGADNSYQTAIRDQRIVGITLIDGYAYKTPEYYLRYYGARLGKLQSWKSFTRRQAARAERKARDYLGRGRGSDGNGSVEDHAMPTEQYVREFPPRDEVAAGFRTLVDRGVEIHMCYSAGIERYYNYRNQFHDSFRDVDFRGRLTLNYFADSNHTFTTLRAQRALVDAIVAWAVRAFGPVRASVNAESDSA